jgi:hypothetical protein
MDLRARIQHGPPFGVPQRPGPYGPAAFARERIAFQPPELSVALAIGSRVGAVARTS